MSATESDLISQLEEAISLSEGLGLLARHRSELTDASVDALNQRSEELRAGRDPTGSEEFLEYARTARRWITFQTLVSTRVDSQDDLARLLRTHLAKLDDGFVELLRDLATSKIRLIDSLAKSAASDNPSAVQAEDAVKEASFLVQFLLAVAQTTSRPEDQAVARFCQGALLTARVAYTEDVSHQRASEVRAEAVKAFLDCASIDDAPPDIRASALANLAVLHGSDNAVVYDSFLDAALKQALAAGDLATAHRIRLDRARSAIAGQDWKTALEQYSANLEETEKAVWESKSSLKASDLVEEAEEDYEGAVESCMQLAKEDSAYFVRALEYADMGKARAFLRSLVDLASTIPFIPKRLMDRRSRILQKMRFSDAAAAPALGRALAETESQIAQGTKSFELDLKCAPVKYGDMSQQVPPGGAIVSYFSLPDRLIVFVLDENGLVGEPASVPVSREKLARASVQLVATIMQQGDPGALPDLERRLGTSISAFHPEQYLAQLYEWTIAPVQEKLEGKDCLYIVPHLGLLSVPFHALIKPGGGHLIDDYAVAYTASIALLAHCRRHHREELKTCFAAGTRGAGAPTSAAAEAVAVAKFFGASSSPATTQAILSQAGGCDVIHLACHSERDCLFTGFRGLELDDGVLLQSEIAGMNCNSSLVVLSACQTASDDQVPRAQMAGLVGAFTRARAPSVVASLWPLADKVGLPTAKAFYSALSRPGCNKARALQMAQIQLKSQAEFSDCYFWAPLSLWGDL